MKPWSTEAVTILVVAVATWAIFVVVRIVVGVWRQRKAEKMLTKVLAHDEEFHNALADYAESIYEVGAPDPEVLARIERLIASRALKAGRGGKLIAEAVYQPSTAGRERYTRRVIKQTLDHMVDVPVEELEIDPPAAPSVALSSQ